MEQLNLSSERRSVVIRDFENVIARYSDYLTETSDKIIYCEYITPKKGMADYGTDYEEFVDIKKNDMKNLTYDQLLLFLKNIDPKKNGGRLDLLKSFLRGRDIPFKDGLWDWRN